MTTTDPATAAARAALLASLCSQSATLSGVLARVTRAPAMIEPRVDGWHGPAELAQAWLVARVVARVADATTPLQRAIDDTNAAIWAVTNDG